MFKPYLSKRGVVAGLALAGATIGLLLWSQRGPRFEGKPASYWVEQLLHDNVKARQALRKIGPAAVPALADAVNRRKNRFRRLLETWRPKLPALLARKLPSRPLDQLLEERAIEVLYEFGPEAAPAVPALVGVDVSLNDFIGFGSAGLAHATLLRIGSAGLPYFIRILGNGNPNTRAQAASYIAHLGRGAGAATPALARALNDSSPAVRNAAVGALARIGPPARAALPELQAALGREDDYFRLEVIRALWTVGRESEITVPILIKILADRGNPNRAGAATVLGEMGPAAKGAEPALNEVLAEEFSYTRVKATEALRRIRKGNPNDEGQQKSE
jgi:HEAT repeat protein